MKTILFICTGNVCRSPMAEALFRQAVEGRGEFRVLSAGLGAVDGQPPTPHSRAGDARAGHGHFRAAQPGAHGGPGASRRIIFLA